MTISTQNQNETPQSSGSHEVKFDPFRSAELLRAFVECKREIQELVLEMASIISDENSTREESTIAFDAMIEALFPGMATDVLEASHEELKSPEAAECAARIKAEERHFSSRVRSLMLEKHVTQEQLGKAAGISQPAVANILNRNCRPQRRTIVKFAEALKVDPKELWPEYNPES